MHLAMKKIHWILKGKFNFWVAVRLEFSMRIGGSLKSLLQSVKVSFYGWNANNSGSGLTHFYYCRIWLTGNFHYRRFSSKKWEFWSKWRWQLGGLMTPVCDPQEYKNKARFLKAISKGKWQQKTHFSPPVSPLAIIQICPFLKGILST